MNTIIFTDGASRGNPGAGGWGAIVQHNDKVRELGGREENTTNNRMELMAAIQGLRSLSEEEESMSGKITVYIDSGYVVKGIREWIHGWEKNGWVTKGNAPVLNSELWKELKKETAGRSILWKLIPGHSGIIANERCDVIATSYADKKPVELFQGNASDYRVSLEIPTDLDQRVLKRKDERGKNGNKNIPAWSYVSKVGDKVHIDKTWKECEARVKGKSGVKYKKVFSQSEEDVLKASW